MQINESEEINSTLADIKIWNPKEYLYDQMKKWGSFTMIISGSRMSGKSAMLKYLLHNPEVNLESQFNLIVVFSKTISNGFYQSFIDSKLMFKDFDPRVIQDLNKSYTEFKEKGKKFRYLIILDDFIDTRTKYINEIADCFYCGRHFGGSIICLTQKLSMLATGWFANTMIFVNLFSGSRQEKEYINNKLVVDSIYDKYPKSRKADIEHIGYFIISNVARDYTALIILPYENERLFRFKAKLTKDRKKQKSLAKSIFEQFEKKIE